jgi:hypothetical protein
MPRSDLLLVLVLALGPSSPEGGTNGIEDEDEDEYGNCAGVFQTRSNGGNPSTLVLPPFMLPSQWNVS